MNFISLDSPEEHKASGGSVARLLNPSSGNKAHTCSMALQPTGNAASTCLLLLLGHTPQPPGDPIPNSRTIGTREGAWDSGKLDLGSSLALNKLIT